MSDTLYVENTPEFLDKQKLKKLGAVPHEVECPVRDIATNEPVHPCCAKELELRQIHQDYKDERAYWMRQSRLYGEAMRKVFKQREEAVIAKWKEEHPDDL